MTVSACDDGHNKSASAEPPGNPDAENDQSQHSDLSFDLDDQAEPEQGETGQEPLIRSSPNRNLDRPEGATAALSDNADKNVQANTGQGTDKDRALTAKEYRDLKRKKTLALLDEKVMKSFG